MARGLAMMPGLGGLYAIERSDAIDAPVRALLTCRRPRSTA
jgi:hypothetical protein